MAGGDKLQRRQIRVDGVLRPGDEVRRIDTREESLCGRSGANRREPISQLEPLGALQRQDERFEEQDPFVEVCGPIGGGHRGDATFDDRANWFADAELLQTSIERHGHGSGSI